MMVGAVVMIPWVGAADRATFWRRIPFMLFFLVQADVTCGNAREQVVTRCRTFRFKTHDSCSLFVPSIGMKICIDVLTVTDYKLQVAERFATANGSKDITSLQNV